MKRLSFSSTLLSTVLIALTAIVLLLLVPAYQGSQKALLEEINITHTKNQRVLQQFFDKHLQTAAFDAEQLSQRDILLSALMHQAPKEAEAFLSEQLSRTIGESIHAFALQTSRPSGDTLQVFNTALLGLKIDLPSLINQKQPNGRWALISNELANNNLQSLLHISFPIISNDFGEVEGTLHAFILLNDNFPILREIQSLSGAESVGLFSQSILISSLSLSKKVQQLLENYQEKSPFKLDQNGKILHRYTLSLNDNIYIVSKVTLPNTSLLALQEAYTKDLGLALIAVLIVGLITVMFISRITKNSLVRLVHYAERMSIHKGGEPFIPGRYEEFNRLGHTVEHMVNRISEHETQLSGIIANTPNIIFIKGADLRYKMVSPNYTQLVGKSINDVIGFTDEEIFNSDHASILKNSDELVFQLNAPQQIEYSIGEGQNKKNYLSNKFPLTDDKGDIYAIGGIVTDITDLKKAQSRSHLAGQIFDQAGEAILVLDTHFNIVSSNSAYKSFSGDDAEKETAFANKIFTEFPMIHHQLQAHQRWQGEIRLKQDRSLLTLWLSASSIHTDEQQQRHLIILSDITALRSAETELERLSSYDGLTNLPNRSLFFDRLDSSIARSKRAKNKTALLFINIDRFKNINDTYGHAVGDKLLVATANRISAHIRPDDTLSRLGGDEFGVIIQNIESLDTVNHISHQVQEALRAPFELDNFASVASVSIGISIFPEDGTDAKTLLTHADTAMHQVKENGRNGAQFYDQQLNQQAEALTQLEEDLRKAFSNDELFLAYQPRFDITGRRILSAEALARWQHPEQGYIPPSVFIELAEQTGFIVELGRFILKTACIAAKSWNINPEHPMSVSVNLSARQIYDPNLIDDITEALAISGLPPELLELEITETLAIENLDKVIHKLLLIQSMGIRMSVDDFGTGYSSLIYLKKLPVSTVKIDRSFIIDVPGNKDDEHIISAIISMSHSLQLTVVAEGVETQEQLSFLEQHNCDEIQGFLLGKPGSKDVLIKHALASLS